MDKYVPCDTIIVKEKTVQRARSKVRAVRGETVTVHSTERRTIRGD